MLYLLAVFWLLCGFTCSKELGRERYVLQSCSDITECENLKVYEDYFECSATAEKFQDIAKAKGKVYKCERRGQK